MPIPRPMVFDGGFQRTIATGDVLASMETFPAQITTAGAYAVPASLFLGALENRAPAGASADTLPTATALIAAIGPGATPGTSYRHRVYNSGAGVITVTAPANAGVTVVAPTVNAASAKDFLVTLTNTTPANALVNANTTNASAVVTGVTQAMTDAISVGMVVTNAVAGLQGATVIGINPGVSVTFSAAANATAANQTINLSPTYTVQGLGQGLV